MIGWVYENHLFVSGSVLIISLLVAGLVTIPQFLKLFETFKSIDQLNQKKASLQSKKETLLAIDLETYRKYLDTALMALPVDKNIPGVTGELLIALGASGMRLDGINFSSGQESSDKVSEYTLKFEVSGEKSNLGNLLERVKLSPRIIKMTTIEVGRGKESLIHASINFVTLHQNLPSSIGDIEEKVPELSLKDKETLADI